MSGDGVTGGALDFPDLGENRRWAPPNEFVDSILAGAGLTVHGGGYLSYPGKGLVTDGLSYVSSAIHNTKLMAVVVNGRLTVRVR